MLYLINQQFINQFHLIQINFLERIKWVKAKIPRLSDTTAKLAASCPAVNGIDIVPVCVYILILYSFFNSRKLCKLHTYLK